MKTKSIKESLGCNCTTASNCVYPICTHMDYRHRRGLPPLKIKQHAKTLTKEDIKKEIEFITYNRWAILNI